MPIALFCLVMLTGYFFPVNNDNNVVVDKYYEQQLQTLKQNLQTLKQSCDQKKPLAVLQQQFKTARLCYKKSSRTNRVFQRIRNKILNGPALNRVEDDNPMVIIKPEGFQVVEEKLFRN